MSDDQPELDDISTYVDDFVQAIGKAGLKLPWRHNELFKEPEVSDAPVAPADVLPTHGQ